MKSADEAKVALILGNQRESQCHRSGGNHGIGNQQAVAQPILPKQLDRLITGILSKPEHLKTLQETFRIALFCLVLTADEQ